LCRFGQAGFQVGLSALDGFARGGTKLGQSGGHGMEMRQAASVCHFAAAHISVHASARRTGLRGVTPDSEANAPAFPPAGHCAPVHHP
jgi:hypothetical protein